MGVALRITRLPGSVEAAVLRGPEHSDVLANSSSESRTPAIASIPRSAAMRRDRHLREVTEAKSRGERFALPARLNRAIWRSYGGGGNRTRVRGRTEQSVYERSSRFVSPAGRFANDQPTGQPSFSVALRAIGSPSAPSPIVGAELRVSGPTRVDVALPSFD
jgi:hypothetical protein